MRSAPLFLSAICLTGAIGLGSNAADGDRETGRLTLTFEVTEPSGAIMAAVFDNADAYGGNGAPVRAFRLPVTAPTVRQTLDALPPGDYAVRAFHDLNDDNSLNTNPFGVPVEPVAFSNGATVRYGPPDWAATRFQVATGETGQTLSFHR
ncbi:hypothetical protein CCR80_02570 [Rhodothalassium salexigens]|uniref:DUF2141 domain-containing protein n=1 Tax=Rhodothalassium salexigens TaxID=1086 RepID=UPI0019143C7E|nr:DUF2141 domain-containing protein [Rhodothalassium salexigens]MBK5919921.1 hypothetical protein [Rhodothalassium salexigens]